MKIFGYDINIKKSIVVPQKENDVLDIDGRQYVWSDNNRFIEIDSPSSNEEFIEFGYNDLDTVYSAINKKADAMNRIKLVLCDREGNEIENHALVDLINKPNSRQSWSDIIDAYAGYYYTCGNFYLYTERLDSNSEPNNLYVFPAQYTNTLADTSMQSNLYAPTLEGYKLRINTISYPAKVEDVIHVSAPTLSYEREQDLYQGMSPFRPLSRKLRLNNGTQTSALKILETGGLRGMFSADPATVKEDAPEIDGEMLNNLKTDFNRKYQGVENIGQVMFTSIPMKWQGVGMQLVDLQLFDAEKMSLKAICNIVGISPLLMGEVEASTYNNLRTARQDLYLTSAIPFYDKLVEHLNNKLVPMYRDLSRMGAYLKLDYSEVPEIQQYKMEQAKSLQPFKTEYTTNELRYMLTGSGMLEDELADLPIYERDNILNQSLINTPLSDDEETV